MKLNYKAGGLSPVVLLLILGKGGVSDDTFASAISVESHHKHKATDFDSDFANALKDAYRFPEKIQRKLKEDYESALADTTREFVNTATRLPTNNAQRVVSALLNFYSQKVNKQIIPVVGQRWQIK